MSIFERLTANGASGDQDEDQGDDQDVGVEQQAATDPDPDVDEDADAEQLQEPAPRGESRDTGDGWLVGYGSTTSTGLRSDTSDAPDTIDQYWQEYYHEFALTRAALKIFDDIVTEPGYRIRATRDGETDEDMQDALSLWAENCVIHAGEAGVDLAVLLNQLPSKRRGKGTVFVEKVGLEGDPDAIGALMLLDPSSIRLYKRQNQNLLRRPDDVVDSDHPRTPTGDVAAYVQYPTSSTAGNDEGAIAFAVDDLIKLTYDADEGEAWGTSIFEAIDDPIDSLRKKINDRDVAIKNAGHPHRIYSSENWSQEEAREYARAHRDGDVSAYDDDSDEGDEWAGRVDFVPDAVEVTAVEGEVADLDAAIKDDIEQIFSLMPVAKYKIAYEEDINQFVVTPQQRKDDRTVDKERRQIERKLQPVFEEKAAELAGGTYDGDVDFTIAPPPEDNPLQREEFPADNLDTLGTLLKNFYGSGANADLPLPAILDLAGIDYDELVEGEGWSPDELAAIDEDDDQVQQQVDEIENQPDPGVDRPGAGQSPES